MPALLRVVMEQTMLFWQPKDAFRNCNDMDNLLEQPVGEPGIGWLTDPAVGRAVPDDLAQEPLADGILKPKCLVVPHADVGRERLREMHLADRTVAVRDRRTPLSSPAA